MKQQNTLKPKTTRAPPKRWAVEKRRILRCGSLDGTRRPIEKWEVDPHYGFHVKRAGAVRALMVSLMPELAGQSDEQIERHYQPWARNVRAHRVRSVRPGS